MKSDESAHRLIDNADLNKMNRRAFCARGVGCAAGWTLLAFPGTKTGILTAQEAPSKEEIYRELDAKAEKYMAMYGSCAMSSFAALNEQFRLKADQAVPALMPFTGGIVAKGETCGAVSGSMLAIGFFFASADPKGNKRAGASMQSGRLFFDRFEKEFGSTRCREVVRHQFGRYYNFLDPEEVKLYMAEAKKSAKCTDVVKTATHMAADIFVEYL